MAETARVDFYSFIMDFAKEDPAEAAFMLTTGLMRGNRAEMRLGYGLGSALATTLSQIPLNHGQIGALVQRVADAKPEFVDYGPTRR